MPIKPKCCMEGEIKNAEGRWNNTIINGDTFFIIILSAAKRLRSPL